MDVRRPRSVKFPSTRLTDVNAGLMELSRGDLTAPEQESTFYPNQGHNASEALYQPQMPLSYHTEGGRLDYANTGLAYFTGSL